MRTTISLPEPLLENARKSAAERGVTLSTVIEDALRHHLSQSDAAKSDEFQLHTVQGKLADPDLDLDRTSELAAQDDYDQYRRTR